MPTNLAAQLKTRLIEQAIELGRRGQFLESAQKFEQSGARPEDVEHDSSKLAFALYRRALLCVAKEEFRNAIGHLETAKRFPDVPQHLRSLFQERIATIQRDSIAEVRDFDAAIAERFENKPSDVDLRDEFLQRYKLDQAEREHNVAAIESLSAVGVYRWVGDINRNDRWSELIRRFKRGRETMPAFFGRILAEHVRASEVCMDWMHEVDYIVPVPASERRTAERGSDIVASMANHLSARLRIPLRPDFLRRTGNSDRSRDVGKSSLATQYSFNRNKHGDIEDRVVLLVDDVMTRGHTAEICASLLRENGCIKVFLLVLALAESTLQSERHS